MKIVINQCYGGFSLSDEAIKLYASKKGITLYPEKETFGFTTYWIVPPEDRPQKPPAAYRRENSESERIAYNKAYSRSIFSDRELSRDDPILIEVVEELEAAANGRHAELAVVEIPDDVHWIIQEYDGCEWIAEKHRTWPN